MKYLLLFLITAYRLTLKPVLSSIFGNYCRFSPSCSKYALIVINEKGVLRGGALAILRILKCHPYYSVKENFKTNL